MSGTVVGLKSGMGGVGGKDEIKNLDEEQLELNLKQLDVLHVKCRELRTTIQRMLETIPNNAPPEEIYKRIVKSFDAARNQIKDFSSLYNNEESKKALDQAKKSRDADPKGIRPWRAKDHPDWLDIGR
ncbi:hypothetical protein F4677DRAFT_430882 [Hypoxylon crocopeplum]|nr:hypothetical protein F4677DRAFT_430882 [Hypoxylon crocopeplum]